MPYYCLTNTLYESPNSTLYQAVGKDPTRQMVLKCFETDAQGMYLREMFGFGIAHPNLIKCLDTFYLGDGRPCMVYEFFQDSTLENWLSVHGKVDLRFCYHCLHELLQALIYLHQANRIHCDIKPGNIFLRLTPLQSEQFILGDLGATCSLREAQESRYGTGTVAYMAPERFYDRFFYNSDLYSLGILAFELLTGERPFLGTHEEIKRGHLSQLPDLERIENLPLRDFIERLLEKDPELRIADAKTALIILNAIQQGQAIAEPIKNSHQQPLKTAEQIVPTGFSQQFQFSAAYPSEKIAVFDRGDYPIVGLEYDSHLDLINPYTNKRDIVLKNGTIQSQAARFFYTSSLKLFQFDLNSYQRQCIYRFNKASGYFQINGEYLLLRSKYDNLYCHLANNKVYKFSQSHYFSTPQACIFENGKLALSAGIGNQQIILRDNQAAVLQTWQLNGCVLAMTQTQQSLLVLTLDLQDSSRYVIWLLTELEPPQHLIISAREIQHYGCTAGCLFWLNAQQQLYLCDSNLNPQLLARLPSSAPLVGLQLSLNHRWLVTLSQSPPQKYLITCFKAEGE